VSLTLVLFVLLAAGSAAATVWATASDRRAREAKRAHDDSVIQLNTARETLAKAQQAEASLKARLEAEQRNSAEKLAMLDKARDSMKDAFAAISSDLLAQNNVRFLDLAKERFGDLQTTAATDLEGRQKAIDELVRPLRE